MDKGVSLVSCDGVQGCYPMTVVRLQATLAMVRSCIGGVCGEAPALAVEHFAPSVLALHEPTHY